MEPDILDDGSSMITAFVNVSNEAFSVEFKLNSVLECQVNGIFGYTGPPTYLKRDMTVRTKGVKRILQKVPTDLPVFFSDSVLQITIYNTKYPSDDFMDPLVLTLTCQGKVFVLHVHQHLAVIYCKSLVHQLPVVLFLYVGLCISFMICSFDICYIFAINNCPMQGGVTHKFV